VTVSFPGQQVRDDLRRLVRPARPRQRVAQERETGRGGVLVGPTEFGDRFRPHLRTREALTANESSHASRGSQRLQRAELFGVATVYAGLGDYDQAFQWLDQAIDDDTIGFYVMHPLFEVLHQDPRFDRLAERMRTRTAGR